MFQLNEATEILRQTPFTLQSLLGGLSDAWIRNSEGEATWSPFDIVGHLIHGEETDWIPRLQIILEHGPSRPFTPFDRFAQFEKSRGKSLQELLATFSDLRRRNLETLEALKLDASQLALRGTHPQLGTVTLGQLLATWAVHDLNHIAQITRVLARRYSAEVGPWGEFLPLLRG